MCNSVAAPNNMGFLFLGLSSFFTGFRFEVKEAFCFSEDNQY